MGGFDCAFLFLGIPFQSFNTGVTAIQALAARAVFEGTEVLKLEALILLLNTAIAVSQQQLRNSSDVDCGIYSLLFRDGFDDWSVARFCGECIDDEHLSRGSLAILPIAKDQISPTDSLDIFWIIEPMRALEFVDKLEIFGAQQIVSLSLWCLVINSVEKNVAALL